MGAPAKGTLNGLRIFMKWHAEKIGNATGRDETIAGEGG